jgi:hypothetical protein
MKCTFSVHYLHRTSVTTKKYTRQTCDVFNDNPRNRGDPGSEVRLDPLGAFLWWGRHASCGGYARAYGLDADWRPGRERRPSERVRRRRKRETRRDCSPHKMTAQGRRVTTSSPKPLVQQPGPCRALPPPPPAQAHLHGRTTGRCPAQLIVGGGGSKPRRGKKALLCECGSWVNLDLGCGLAALSPLLPRGNG